VDPKTGQHYLDEAEAFRKDLLAAVERSSAYAPVIKVQDGTYRRCLPPYPYLRGMATELVLPNAAGHGGPGWVDVEFGALALADVGVLDPRGQLVGDFLDILEDKYKYDNIYIRQMRPGYQPETDAVEHGGYHYQNGYDVTPMVYLRRDDIPNFLRATWNQYVAEIVPGEYTLREINVPGFGVTDKTFEEAAFLERVRCMLVMESGQTLWLARGTPRAWLEPGKSIVVQNAPTFFGKVSYNLAAEDDRVWATVELPSRKSPQVVELRLRRPVGKTMTAVAVNGRPWKDFVPQEEVVSLSGLIGTARVEVFYE